MLKLLAKVAEKYAKSTNTVLLFMVNISSTKNAS